MDEDLIRRKNILNVLLVGSVTMLVILDAFVLFHTLQEGPAYRDVPFAAFSVLPAFFILLHLLSRRGFSTLVTYLFIGAYFVSDSYAVYRYGVGMQVAMVAYALIIVMATILRGTKFGFFITGVIAAFIIPLWYIQLHGMLAVQAQRPTADDAVVFVILYLLIMVVAWLYDREIERSLNRARASEKALKEERDMLEVRVIERTDELRRTQLEKVEQLGRLAELGQLSSGLFHDILNLLNTLSLRTEKSTDPSLASAFDTTKQIQGFMEAVRKQIRSADNQESFSLTQGIDHAIQLVNYQANKTGVRIVFKHDPDKKVSYHGTPFKFQEIVINLLLNAIESYGTISGADDRARIIEISVEERAKQVVLRVADNGCGMTSAVRARIFEPFFTTKDAAKGIGIGLPSIKNIIEKDLSGTIAVESEPGLGSIFTVTFPSHHGAIPEHDRSRDRMHPERAIP